MAAKVLWHGRQALAQIKTLVAQRLDAAAVLLVGDIKEDMARAKSGAPITGGPGRGTRASRPGESPAVRTAQLINSVTWERARRLVRRIGTNLKKGYFLEIGWGPRGEAIARPWLRPALYRNREKIRRLFR